MPRRLGPLLTVVLLAFSARLPAEEPAGFFQKHCLDCHGPDDPEAGLRLDSLKLPTSSADAAVWEKIADRVESGDMPPKGQDRPDPAAVRALTSWIGQRLAKVTTPTPGLRRLNRFEYENTVHDLLGIDAPLADLLPEDAEVQGFDNVAGGLGISSILLERYLEAADAAFEATIRRVEPLPPATRTAVLMEQKENIASVKGNKGGVVESHGAFVDFTPGWPPARVDPAHPIEDGRYRVRVEVFPHDPGDNRTLAVGVYVGPLFGPGKRRFMGLYDVTGTPEKPRVIEFTTHIQESHAVHVLPWVYPEHVTWRDKHEKRPGVAIKLVETHGPLDQPFPSLAQRRLFGESDTLAMAPARPVYMRHRRGVKLHDVVSTSPREDAERIVRDFVPRAFRRPVEDELVQPFVDLTLSRLDQGRTFEQAVRAGVSAVLCSPHFLLVNREPEVDDFTIASRLSYFLWSSMPDDELRELAAAGRLRDPKVRHAQVERMLGDPKAERFVVNFTDQWLDLKEIEFTTPAKKLYPEFDEMLQRSMLAETRGFFRHVLENDLPVRNFVDSDFAVLNQRLAEHYGITGVKGHEQFRIVKLPTDSVRGGVLAHASVLKVTANGTTTSPIVRGAWVLDRLLGQPAPPPPAGVPAVDPDIRGATTIREQLDLHRSNAACNRCHARIDPPGFALEEFDPIGGHRDWYRTLGGPGKRVGKLAYHHGPDVERGAELYDGRDFADFREFRRLLLEQEETVARALATKLLVYGSGRPVTRADQASVDAVLEATQGDEYGLRSMIHAVVETELFHRP